MAPAVITSGHPGMNGNVIFLQQRTHRAGAQTCLARLLRHPGMHAWQPALVCAKDGWLTEDCRSHAIPCLTHPFPSSRALLSRWFRNANFARETAHALARHTLHPLIIQANDHLEGLLGLELAQRTHARCAIFLRSPGMTREDYFKYRCPDYDLIIAVGDELQARARSWDPGRNILLIHDGIESAEYCPPKPKPVAFPKKILVIGSSLDWKGWSDLTEALHQLQQGGQLPEIQFDFTGDQPDPTRNNLRLERMSKGAFHFLGRVEKFRDLVRQYDLAINPSRHESFGMAAIEVLFAGVPLLSSRSGIIEQVQENPAFLFAPQQPEALAASLKHLLQQWPELDTSVVPAQENIQKKFLVDYTVQKLSAAYTQLLSTGTA
ncbi:MAG: glycosyltransferase family 4 protein [Verrucomicrobiota bacterium]